MSAPTQTFMGVVQRTAAGSNQRISRVVSKSDSTHWSGYYGHRTLGLTPAGTICHSTRSLGYYPLHITSCTLSLFYLSFPLQVVQCGGLVIQRAARPFNTSPSKPLISSSVTQKPQIIRDVRGILTNV